MVALAVVALVGALAADRRHRARPDALGPVRGGDPQRHDAGARPRLRRGRPRVGSSTPRIVFRTLLPNIASSLIVVATYEVGQAILLEAAFSFLGFGVQPPMPSWGLMISEGKRFIFVQPWMTLIPGIAILSSCSAINLLGDGIRDEPHRPRAERRYAHGECRRGWPRRCGTGRKVGRPKFGVAGLECLSMVSGRAPSRSLSIRSGPRARLFQWFFPTRTFRARVGQEGRLDRSGRRLSPPLDGGFGALTLGRNMFGPVCGLAPGSAMEAGGRQSALPRTWTSS